MSTEEPADEAGGYAGNLSGKPDVYVPQEVCDALGIEIGDGVEYEIFEDRVVMRAGETNKLGFEGQE
jgi:hypothetical protein